MSQFFHIHPDNPQLRLIKEAVKILQNSGIIAYPTDSCYALACSFGNKAAWDRICQLRGLKVSHKFSLICRDLSELSKFACVDNLAFRTIKHNIPGPYTFILKASKKIPRRLLHAKRKTIGIRVPANAICTLLVEELGEPLISTTLVLPNMELPLTDPEDIYQKIGKQLDLVIDGGFGQLEMTTVVSLVDTVPAIIREGLGTLPLA